MRFPFRPELIGDVRSGNWHGGVIATALDAAGGMAAASLLKSKADQLATLDIRVDYTNLQAFNETTEELLADGRAVFSVRRAE